jgi:glycosyltransferase involved in cell wall biosynthesis
VAYSKQYVRDFGGEDWFSKKKKSQDILFLNAAMTTTNVNAVDNLIKYIIPHLKDLKNKNDKIFDNLVVAGVENELTNKIKNLNIPWIVFPGWINTISEIYLRSKCMIIPNNSFLGSRTKVFHALSCGLPVITHECNIRYHPNLINKKNVLKANNFEHMKKLISEFLNGEINEIELSLNARKAFEQNYKKEEILNILVSKIENI